MSSDDHNTGLPHCTVSETTRGAEKEELVAADLHLEADVDMPAPGRRGLIFQPEKVRDIKI